MAKAPKITTEDRALILRTAHNYRRETGLDWSTCQLAAWAAFRDMKFNQVFQAYEAASVANETTYDACKAFAEHPNPYRATMAELNSAKYKKSRSASDAVFHAKLAAKYAKAA